MCYLFGQYVFNYLLLMKNKVLKICRKFYLKQKIIKKKMRIRIQMRMNAFLYFGGKIVESIL